MLRKKFKLGNRRTLVKNLLIVDGVARSGKFVLSNVLTGFKGVEPIQCRGLLESLPFLEHFGLLNKRAAQELLRQEVDVACYEMLVGRNLNHRRSDLSSIFNHPLYKRYLQRVNLLDGDAALRRYEREQPYSLFITHEVSSNTKIYLETFPHLKIICLRRSPMSLVYEWLQRGLGRRYGNDPRLFDLIFQARNGLVPWFVTGWGDEFYKLSETDRVIKVILTLHTAYDKFYSHLSPEYKSKILILTFEDVLFKTNAVIKRASEFLGRPPLSGLKKINKRLILPRPQHPAYCKEVLTEIKSAASSKYFKLLLATEKVYRSKFKPAIPHS